MDVTIFAGKGGVGKSTCAAAYALKQAKNRKVHLVGYDPAQSLQRVLAMDEKIRPNSVHSTGIENLDLTLVEGIKFDSFEEVMNGFMDGKSYLNQFKEDEGYIPYLDMAFCCFGILTDIDNMKRFISFIKLYQQFRKSDCELVMDVEPTAGLERLLGCADSASRSIQNLRDMSWVKVKALGATWPDIAKFIEGEYVKDARLYTKRLVETAKAVKDANYLVVCIPESSPVEQMRDIERLIASHKGKVIGYVVNNIRGEPHEAQQIKKVRERAEKRPVIEIKHNPRLYDSKISRIAALYEIGKLIKFDKKEEEPDAFTSSFTGIHRVHPPRKMKKSRQAPLSPKFHSSFSTI